MITGPYFLADYLARGEVIFNGFLLNPIDGYTYLAKMQQGWDGAWKFVLPYTASPGEGAFLFLFYLFLGHIARWSGLPTLEVFHIVRVCASIWLLINLWNLCRTIFKDNLRIGKFAVLWVVLGSGLGWVAGLFGAFTADFWVAEAYPFLSMYSNPHFPFGLAILVLWINYFFSPPTLKRRLLLLIFGFVEGIVLPFGIVVATMIFGIVAIEELIKNRKIQYPWQAEYILSGGVVLIYQYWSTLTDPVLRIWNEQNVTPSPSIGNLMIAMSPAVVLALFMIFRFSRLKPDNYERLLSAWLIGGLVLIFIPFNLQRRFMLGIYIPACLLGIKGLWTIFQSSRKRFDFIFTICFLFSIITNTFVVLGGVLGAAQQMPELVVSKSDLQAFEWLNNNVPPQSLFFASPEVGLKIPAYTGNRVIYGHPYETARAEQELEFVNSLFSDWGSDKFYSLISQRDIDYIYLGSEERKMIPWEVEIKYPIVYENPQVKIYKVADE